MLKAERERGPVGLRLLIRAFSPFGVIYENAPSDVLIKQRLLLAMKVTVWGSGGGLPLACYY
jgi:hypothetical protein